MLKIFSGLLKENVGNFSKDQLLSKIKLISTKEFYSGIKPKLKKSIEVLQGNHNNIIDMMPVDFASNYMIVIAVSALNN